MLRLTLAARIAMIVIVSLTAVWIVAVAAFYQTHADDFGGIRPSPARIAALTELVESATASQRLTIMEAVTTNTFRPTLRVGSGAGGVVSEASVTEQEFRDYAAALAGRGLTIRAAPRSTLAQWFPRLIGPARNALEFQVALRNGESLVIETGGPLVINRIGLPVGFGAGLFGTLVAIGALLIMQRETRPLARLAAAVDRIDLSSDPAPLPEMRGSAPEIRALAQAFNRLKSRLGAMLHARMALIGGISHDVRTFATRLRLRVDAIPQDAERQRAIADIDDMIRLLDDALMSSRAGAGELNREMVEFAALVALEVDDRRTDSKAIDLFSGSGTEHAIVLGDRLALRRIITNLTDNALKYGHAAHLRIAMDGDRVVLTVDDEGPGIRADQREVILEPFSRLDESRSRETGGAGLGLAVVRTLTEAHGGDVRIGENAHGGCCVTISFPIFTGQ